MNSSYNKLSPSDYHRKRVKLGKLIFVVLAILLAFSFLLGLSVGAVDIPFNNVIEILLHSNSSESMYAKILLDVRLPRVIATLFVGAALASSGVSLQTLFRNQLAEPYILGIASGALLGVCIVVVLGVTQQPFGPYTMSFMAFLGAFLTTLLVYTISKGFGLRPISVLLIGLAFSFLLSSMVTFLEYLALKDIHLIFSWIMGSFSAIHWNYVQIMVVIIPLGLFLLLVKVKDLNTILLGEEYAKQLGVDIKNLTQYLIIVVAILVSVSVASAGIIGFVGLVIPHIARLLVGYDNKFLMPASALIGASFLSMSDALSRIVIRPSELPIGVVTSLIGAPLFIYLLLKRGRGG
ncbi:MAG: iron ABC transporter permease [archaeon]|nr:iron ABC transporter permease [archaeon]MCP8321401.1 iron ABC transporter permease [archaeon]